MVSLNSEQGSVGDSEGLMKLMYRSMYGIDWDNCVKLDANPSKLEIKFDGKVVGLADFLSDKIKTIAVDQFSTKESNDKYIAEVGMPEEAAKLIRQIYLEAHRVWAVVKNDEKAIGIADRLHVYNGFPAEIDFEEYVRNPDEVYRKVVEESFMKGSLATPPFSPRVYNRVNLRFDKEFLARNPIGGIGSFDNKSNNSWITNLMKKIKGGAK